MTAAWREKIKASMLLNRLQDHVEGKVEMTSTQIRAAEILLKKCLPDLTENTNRNNSGYEETLEERLKQIEQARVHRATH